MRELILKMSISIDGFVGGQSGEIDWIFATTDAAATAWTMQTIWQAGVHAMGSRTFQDMAAFWPTSTEVFAAPMNQIPKVVFSRMPQVRPDPGATSKAFRQAMQRRAAAGEDVRPVAPAQLGNWATAEVTGADLAQDVARLKREPGGPILAHGGAGLAQGLVRLDLVDEYRLLVHPVALGRGLPLFAGVSTPHHFNLVASTPFPGGAVAQVYRLRRS